MRKTLILSGAVVLVMFAISGYVWTQVPAGAQICTHWNMAGECDGYSGKFVGIYLMPIINVAMVGLFHLLSRIDSRVVSTDQSRKAYSAVWVTMLLVFFVIHSVMMLNVLGLVVDVVSYWPVLVGLAFIVIGSSIGKLRSNSYAGIRTPWTLASELSWSKTHTLGGKLFVLQGIFFMVAAIVLSGEVLVYLLIGSSLVMVVFLAIYSYTIWKGDSDVHATQPPTT